ncbi:hypothetical protein [Clostridium massiliamazoniense]|uniref:hypothetical protein n=1 Tax=Clostridium massiliamazoniense TaxID=1347366 RepID=UPI0006D79BD3|nr:hypothetical protein [Clostridium massiliamazoniense]
MDNDINGNNIYSSSDRMKVYPTTASEFKILFGVTPKSLGLEGNNFNVDTIGNVFIYQLPNKNIVFSFENIAGFAINNSNAIKPSNISNWYGIYTIKNKVGQINGFNSYGIKSINLTGKKVVIGANEFKYGTTVIQNPQYYILKVNPNSLNGNGTYSGIELTNGEGYFLAVLGKNEKMTNFLYDGLPPYIGCTSGAWAADIAMPIILAPNGTIQVMNNNEEFYSTIKNS